MKTKFFVTLVLYFSPLLWTCLFHQGGAGGVVRAQYRKLDSLKSELQNHPTQDLKHLQLLQLIAEAQEWAITKDGLITTEKAIALAKKLNNQKELAAAYTMKTRLLIYDQELDRCEKILDSAFSINRSINNQRGLADNYLVKGIIKNFRGANVDYNMMLDSASFLIKPFNDIKIQGRIQYNKGLYYSLFNADSSTFFYKKSLQLFEQIADTAWLANNYTWIARNFLNVTKPNMDSVKACIDKIRVLLITGGYKDFYTLEMVFIVQSMSTHAFYLPAIAYLTEVLPIAIETKNNLYQQYVYFNLAMTYQNLANFPQAIKFYDKSLRISEKLNDDFGISATVSNMGMIYRDMKDYNTALRYLKRGRSIAIKFKNNYHLACNLHEIGDLYLRQNKFNESFDILMQSLELAKEAKADDAIAVSYGLLGDYYAKTNHPDSAFYYFNKAAVLNKKMGVTAYYAKNLLSMSRTIKDLPDYEITDMMRKVFNQNEKYKKAIEYAGEALSIVKETGELDIQRDASLLLSELYEKENNTAASFKYYKQYVVLNDSILNTENSKAITNLQLQYNSEKQEQQIALLNKDKELQHENIEKQKTTRNVFIGGFTLVLLLAGATYNRYRLKQKANNKIENTLVHLKNTQEQLVQQGKLAALGKMTSEVAMEIQNPLHDVKVLSSENELLVEAYIHSKTDEERNQILDKLEINFDAITQHGKMADGIVKNVLMQSRR